MEAEYCALLGKGNTSHGYCKRTDWPPPFSWVRYLQRGSGLCKVLLMHPGKKKRIKRSLIHLESNMY